MNSLALSTSSKKPISPPPLSPRNGSSFSKAPLSSESTAMQSNSSTKTPRPRHNKRSSVPAKQEALEDSTTRRRTHRSSGKSLSTGSFADFKPSKTLSQESVIILKRGALDNLSLGDPIATLSEEESSHQRSNERFNHYSGDKEPSRSRDSSPSRRRNHQQPSSKARRAQRRKDTEAMVAEALHISDGDLPLGTSPPQTSGNSSSGESSDDVVVIPENMKVATVSKPDPKKRSKRERVSSSPAATASSSFPLITAAEKASEVKSSSFRVTFAKLPHQGRRGSSPSIEMRPQNNTTLPAPLILTPYDESFLKATPRTPTSSITTSQKTSPLYAGPTFSNSPAPDALPLPSFQSRGLGESTLSSAYSHPPTTPTQASFVVPPPRSVSLDMDENIFRMESVNEPNTPIYYHDRSRPRDILSTLATSHPKTLPQPLPFAGPHVITPMPQSYHLPPKMMTSHTVHNVITHEMTMRLRSMLKIE